jgi:hypothetical protein
MSEGTPGGERRTERAAAPDPGLYAAPVVSVFAALLLAALLFHR